MGKASTFDVSRAAAGVQPETTPEVRRDCFAQAALTGLLAGGTSWKTAVAELAQIVDAAIAAIDQAKGVKRDDGHGGRPGGPGPAAQRAV